MHGPHLLRSVRQIQYHGARIPLKKGSFANQLGTPDYIFVCMDTVSHPLVISAQKEARKHGAQLVKLRRGSASALERELIRVTTQA